MRLANLFKRASKQTTRESRIEAIEQMGMKLIDEKGWHEGKYYTKRYILQTADGRRLDNSGVGFPSTYSAYQAALAESKKNEDLTDSGPSAGSTQP